MFESNFMEGGWKNPPQCYNEIRKPSAYRVKIPRELQTCGICRQGIGNEFHYFAKCDHPLFVASREKYMERLKYINKSLLKLDEFNIISHASAMLYDNILSETAKYIHELMTSYDLVVHKCPLC